MKKYSCVIIDDEPLAIDKLKRFIGKEEDFEIIGAYSSANEVKDLINVNSVDLFFLDIQMPNMSGMDFAKTNKITRPIIFTTAYEKYAIESFDLNVADYLLKPFSQERFKQACAKVKERLNLEYRSKSDNGFILINSEHQILKIKHDDILYIEGLKDYVKIFTTSHEKPILTRQNLKKILSQLPEEFFIRAHRSYIVAIGKIQKVAKQKIIVNGTEIPLGDLFKDELLKIYFK